MPRVPIIGTDTGRIAVAPQQSPFRTLAIFERIGDSIQPLQDFFEAAAAKQNEAQNSQDFAKRISDFTNEMTDLGIVAKADPEFEGSTDRYVESLELVAKEIVKGARSSEVSDELNNRFQGLIASSRVGIANSERKRFVSSARVELRAITKTAIEDTVSADSDLVREQVHKNFLDSIVLSSAIDAKEQETLLDMYNQGVSTTRMLRMLESDPDTLIDIIDDPDAFPGILPDTREVMKIRALGEADQRERAEEASARREIDEEQEENTIAMLSRLGDGEDPSTVRAAILEDTTRFNLTQHGILRTALRTSEASFNDREIVVNLDKDITEGNAQVVENINQAYIGRSITLDTRNSLLFKNASKSGPIGSATDLADKFLVRALAPGPDDIGAPKQEAALRLSLGREEMALFLDTNPTDDAILDKSRLVVKALGEGIFVDSINILRNPFGVPVNRREVTYENLAESDKIISRTLNSNQMSEDEAIFQSDNNDALRETVRIRLASEEKK